MAGYKFDKRFTLYSGVNYISSSQSSHYVNILVADYPGNKPGISATAVGSYGAGMEKKGGIGQIQAVSKAGAMVSEKAMNPGGPSLRQDLEYVEIPVEVVYKMINGKFSAGLTGGLSTNFLVGNKVKRSNNGDLTENGKTPDLRSVVCSGVIGLEFGYEIANRITLTVEPRYRQAINSLSTNKSVNYKPAGVEIATGLSYSFN